MDISFYQLAINNTARFLRSDENRKDLDSLPRPGEEAGQVLNAFTASTVLAVAFCKTKEDVIGDLIAASLDRKISDLENVRPTR